MGQHVFDLLRNYLAHYGYGAVAAALLLENAGLPVPGETMLLLASFLAFSEHRLRLPYIIMVGVCAATIGDNLGFLLGHYGGKQLLEHYRKVPRVYRAITRGESLIQRYGSFAIFIARFIAGMRIIAGPSRQERESCDRPRTIPMASGSTPPRTSAATAGRSRKRPPMSIPRHGAESSSASRAD